MRGLHKLLLFPLGGGRETGALVMWGLLKVRVAKRLRTRVYLPMKYNPYPEMRGILGSCQEGILGCTRRSCNNLGVYARLKRLLAQSILGS